MSIIDHPTTIDRNYIRLLQAMRRFVRDEFACDIRITQDDVIEQLLHFAECSANHVLREMGKELHEFVQQLHVEDSGDNEQKVRYYRGVAIPITEDEHDTEAVSPSARGKKPSRIYRGQVIGG